MSKSNKMGTALVTGASTGIGAVYADRLARRGYDLVIVARRKDDLEKLATKLRAETGVQIRVLPADLTAESDLAQVEKVLREDAAINLLINNAGTATIGPLADADIARLHREIQLNIVAPTRLAHAAVPGLVARGHGAIVNIASVMSQMVQPGNSVYGGTKAYLLHFSQVLEQEVAGSGVRVQTVLPGATRTAIWDDSGVELHDLPAEMIMEVDEMVDAALAGFDQGEGLTVPALPNVADWQRLIDAREALKPNLSHRHAADRYKIEAPVAA
ncbi:MAG: family NAD(P)-dependent oxidoreductase [Nevskia sp.]|nr:family NAD(P)-dependent oxidoreductase [Nevskia sp.]